eukprot:gnl/TRDRNA2_/TRDRNA2_145642_c1_seq1.p1 gnl/TRDRNA2_/TRDRNA2_145642_c1~~gnl/TRDRNA2_/TRDRNA2_145642_c1_seq1.p1  ORF type:complete len:196 (-),score=34.18 gnl/TRDRNA2_/TRDRNA2_145642_c1_seq1:140-727(-)
MNGFFSVGGPPLMVFALYLKPLQESWTAALAAIFSLDGSLRLGYLLWIGALGGLDQWLEYFVLALGVSGGLAVGTKAKPHISDALVRRLILFFLCISTLGMCTGGVPMMPHRWRMQLVVGMVISGMFTAVALCAVPVPICELSQLQPCSFKPADQRDLVAPSTIGSALGDKGNVNEEEQTEIVPLKEDEEGAMSL